ncbi:bacteroides aerotolerance operon [Vibrio ishigakensis]|uniref:Bacteroides aerotolerance operon n=1 Tax=Vibrio ishigakensis TaxID=1481914 RepID=A0A0B8PKF2_9VIBR|nr:bacteroides aerotolerance operon [Vibrio ishigakensis]
MVALDLSGSMSERDFVDAEGNKQDRLTVAKQVLTEFGAKRKDDRLGLILFADALMCKRHLPKTLTLG